jgi:hypothetical protein
MFADGEACLFRFFSWFLLFLAAFLPPWYGLGHHWNEEGLITYYRTRVGREFLSFFF